MRTTAAAPALLALALMVGAAGCGADEPKKSDAPVASSPSSSTPKASGTPTSGGTKGSAGSEEGGTPFTADTRPDDGGPGSGNGLGLTGVRTSRHPGFDRIVFDLGGTGKPGWHVEYVDRPVADGSGEPVKLRGTAFLQVVLHGMGYPGDPGVPPPLGDDSTRLPGTGTRGVTQIAPGGVFEGDQQAFIGLTGSKRPFRVFALTGPTRLVVDVRDR